MPSPSPRVGIELLSLIDIGRGKNLIDKLLADIPALSVGLLGFATFTFFMILKKVKLAPFLILTSVLFLFFAAILDLARISLLHDNTGPERHVTKGVTHSLITVREGLSSASAGLRFLYFWAFVSQPPLCELGTDSFLRLHSGSWLHWGLTGRVLRWATLTSSIAILVLQAVWRLMTRQSGPVYDIESSLEISTSVVYIVKLFLNSLIVEQHCRRQTLWQYSATLFALLINLGVGIGNLLLFSFSETALGRLLLATELYILIVSSMIFSFYMREVTANSLPRSRDKRTSSFRGLHGTIYDNGLGLVGEDGTNPVGQDQSSPSWLSWNASQRHSSQMISTYGDGRRPRAEEEAERGVYPPLPKERGSSIPEDILSSSVNSSAIDPITQGISEGFSSPTIRLPSGSVNDNGKSSTPTAAAMATAPDSPTLPLGGIRETREINRPSRRENPTSDGSIVSSQLSGFEDPLREQDELDRSIAAVRAMFVPGRSGELPRGASPDTASDHPERGRFRESSTTAYGPTSASGRSEFSLSVFPEPPQVPMIAENLRRSGLRSSTVPAPTPTQSTYSIGEQALPPVSTAEGDNVAFSASGRRTESAATHYDVTSFIGDLTSPDLGSAAQIAKYLKYSDTDSETEDSIDLATIVTVQRRPSTGVIARPQVVEKASLIPDVPVSASASTLAQPPDRSARHPPPRPPSPPPPPAFARAPSARSLVTPTGRVGLPPRPKLDDSRRGDQQMGKVLNTQHR